MIAIRIVDNLTRSMRRTRMNPCLQLQNDNPKPHTDSGSKIGFKVSSACVTHAHCILLLLNPIV